MNFLEHYGDMYVSKRFPEVKIGNFNIEEHFTALLNRVHYVSENINSTLVFLEDNEKEISDYIVKIFNTLELKTQIITDSIQYASKLKFETGDIPSDISIIDMSSGIYSNCLYSTIESGIVLDNVDKIYIAW